MENQLTGGVYQNGGQLMTRGRVATLYSTSEGGLSQTLWLPVQKFTQVCLGLLSHLFHLFLIYLFYLALQYGNQLNPFYSVGCILVYGALTDTRHSFYRTSLQSGLHLLIGL